MNAITEAMTVNEAVEAINSTITEYHGGTDLRSSEDKAAEYALLALADSGEQVNEDSVWAHLEYIQSQGAEFDFDKALKSALS